MYSYTSSKQRTRNHRDSDFPQLNWVSNQSIKNNKRTCNFLSATIMITILLQKFEIASLLSVTLSCSIFTLGSGLLDFSVANDIEDSKYRSLSKHLRYKQPSLQTLKPVVFIYNFMTGKH